MTGFRYAQFCPLARAAELVGERWTLLIVRELLMGPCRYTDLRRSLPGVSASVLTERLARLEERDIVVRRTLPPPAASNVYELGETGRALAPVVRELAVWGTRFLSLPLSGDHVPARAVRVSLSFALRSERTPRRSFELRIEDAEGDVAFRVTGGARGARIADTDGARGAPDARVVGDARTILCLAAGDLDVSTAIAEGTLRVEGDADALADLPRLFDAPFETGSGPAGPANPPDESPATP